MLGLGLVEQSLNRPIHRGLTLNNILPRLAGGKYIMLIDVTSGYH